MINYSKKNTIIITLILTIVLYSIISVIWSIFFPKKSNTNIEETTEFIDTKDIEYAEKVETNTEESLINQENVWKIEIPKIDLVADIQEGTNKYVIAKNVGHFTTTGIVNGNIGLAAHNRGFGEKSYFKNIKYLSYGDEIIYKKGNETKKYEVVNNLIIDETDWSYLQNTEDNRITLITCVEDMPEYRRCVQGIEI